MPRLTSKGQVTIPKRVRDQLGLRPGCEVEFQSTEQGDVVLKARAPAQTTSRFAAIRGILRGGMTTDELMKLTRGWGEPDREDK